jgi:hypothetical protein
VTEATRVHSEIETDRIRDAISDYWGEECPEKDADCACCKAWAQLAALERQLADYKAAAEACWPLFDPHGPVTGSAEWQATWGKAEVAIGKVKQLEAALEQTK